MRIYLFDKKNIIRLLVLALLVSTSLIYSNLTQEEIISVFSNKKELPIYSVDTDEKKVAISFDAAWGAQYTKNILDILDEYNVKTTFFLVGFWVDRYPEMVKEIHNRGHEIGNHSSNHPRMSRLSKQQIVQELKETEEKIKKLTGQRTNLFRPPFGDYNNRLIQTCRENGYYVIQWDVDSLDWKELGVQPVVDRVTRKVKKGSIVLFHNNAKYVTKYLPVVIRKLQEKGYEIVPISELIYKDNYYIDHAGKQIKKPQ
ncbi:polysaccharide deacetylase family sporulation protein PdaB [Thermohalobacter berrensis]|uniref:Polysaccharide deacetylase family sporulation protein PdaB n=1 Tax=Thermohalobacter berrensis TaxID=99594 RepID=A0A419T2N4_9FIRM|nr:polysaccharide deacetylase family sporulation protein PdaB [Thermohalobacter berrensis]RKD31810.1 polysaccharide deacetylase family sporulation protein PdaB [Thermohalobacter berrensis]